MLYISKTNILDQCRINLALFQHLLQERVYNVIEIGIFETTLLSFCERGSNGEGNNNIVGVLLGASEESSACHRERGSVELTYIPATPVFVEDRWEKIEPNLWDAMLEDVVKSSREASEECEDARDVWRKRVRKQSVGESFKRLRTFPLWPIPRHFDRGRCHCSFGCLSGDKSSLFY